jgi:YHS domain-containing protein
MSKVARTFGALMIAVSLNALAGSPISGAKDGVAIQGYDPVAYFVQREAVKGSPEQIHQWSGTVWFFSSAENKSAFAAEPDKYAPQFGGHCSLSMAKGRASRGAGDAWSVLDGKLYLNGNQEARATWLRNTSQSIYWADKEWPRIRDRLLAE